MDRILKWFEETLARDFFNVVEIPFHDMEDWYFDDNGGNLRHSTGKFFCIEGIQLSTNYGQTIEWEQPIINQPEIGILGILTKLIDGRRYYLMQAKMEPGNVNNLQLSPTVQATKSNYTRVHLGKKTEYLEYFLDNAHSDVLFDQLQTEQGGRFLKKRNRNLIVEVQDEVEVFENYQWMDIDDISQLLKVSNFVNMDSRSVLCCMLEKKKDIEPYKSIDQIINWYTSLKFKYKLNVKMVSLKDIDDWVKTEYEIKHNFDCHFRINAVKVRTRKREVREWSQPLIKEDGLGLIGFLTTYINDNLHFLVQGKVEAGSMDKMYMAPTIQCSTYKKRFDNNFKCPPYLKLFVNAKSKTIKYDVIQSEEGGRFYHLQDRHLVIHIEDHKNVDVLNNYNWLNYNQILEFIKHGYFNIEGRSLITCFGLTRGKEINQ